jgi:hypothetical protein
VALTVLRKDEACQAPFSYYAYFMPKKIGRPKLPKAKVRAPGISLRLRADEERIIHAAIERSEQTKSEWLRDALLEKARKG